MKSTLSVTDRISYKQRQILIHSYIYYNMDTNVITDQMYDKLSYGLVEMIKQHPDEFMESDYFVHFIGYDGTTGFGLYEGLSDKEKFMVEQISWFLCRKDRGNK